MDAGAVGKGFLAETQRLTSGSDALTERGSG